MIKVLPLKGFKSLRALQAFNTLLLGLKMMPAYAGITYEDFANSFKDKSEGEKESYLREALSFVELGEEEVKALICFAKDPNGIAYSGMSLNNLGVEQIFEIVIAVCMEIGRIKIDLISEDEKKKLSPSQ